MNAADANPQTLRAEMLTILRRDGVVTSPRAVLTPLSGGVSSEIYLVTDGARQFVVKRALAQLKVRDAWFADTRRNAHEQAYLRYVGSFLPDAVPALIEDRGTNDGYFAMEFLGDGFANWKAELLAGHVDIRHGQRAMTTLATIHAHSANDARIAHAFDTTEDFKQLRVDPYLLTTGARHPPLSDLFTQEAARLVACREALVHGDFSPKNILIGPDNRLVLLDCEVAWFGDPAFDVGFLLNHLLLKALHHAPADVGLRAATDAAWMTYRAARDDASAIDAIDSRLTRLLPMLLLARVDGKSPVEYLDSTKQAIVRAFVYDALSDPSKTVSALFGRWFAAIERALPTSAPDRSTPDSRDAR